jgi:TetR/AcrR family transcriptional regulator
MISKSGISGGIMNKHEDQALTARERILQSALTVIIDKKVSGMRIRDVAREADASLGTIHYHFPAKSALLVDILAYMKKRYDEDRQKEYPWDKLEPKDKLAAFFTQEQNLLEEEPERETAFLDFWGQAFINTEIKQKIQQIYREWRAETEDVLQEGIEKGLFVPIDTRIASFIIIALIEGFALQYLIEPDGACTDDFFTISHQLMLKILSDPEFWTNIKSLEVRPR